MKTTLRYKLFAWFLLFAFLIVVFIIPINYIHSTRQNNQFYLQEAIHQLKTTVTKDLKNTSNFLAFETIKSDYFITGESDYVEDHEKNIATSDSLIQTLQRTIPKSQKTLINEVQLLEQNIAQYHANFDSIVELTYFKGNKNFGLEGELNEIIFDLQSVYHLPTVSLNDIKLNTNDYLLYRKDIYAFNVHALVQKILKQTRSLKEKELLQAYNDKFGKLVKYDAKIGIGNNNGIFQNFLYNASGIEQNLELIGAAAKQYYQASIQNLKLYYVLFVGLILLLSLGTSFVLSKRLTAPLHNLTKYIKELAKNNFHFPANIKLNHAAYEVNTIYDEFRHLVHQLSVKEAQRNKARQRSYENEKKYRELTEMLPQSIFETDALGNYTYVNKHWQKTFGFSTAELNDGVNLIETLISEKGERIMDEKVITNHNFVARRKDGSFFQAAVYTTNITNENKIIGKRGIVIDVSDKHRYIQSLKKEKQRAQYSDSLKSSFLANMSHEIRTPMNTIIGFSDLLDSTELSEEQKHEFINHIKSSGEMLLHLIDDIIDIAKIEAGEIKINRHDTDLYKLFNELQNTFIGYKKQLQKDHLELILNIPDEHHIVKSDQFRLKQILHNLISNAVKFTSNGHIEFGYRVKQDKLIEFFVNDTGIGLTQDKLDVIFKRFKQISSSEAKKSKGSGLGLAISKNLVELLGGHLWVESEKDKGTRFTFTHPFVSIRKEIANKPEFKQPDASTYNWKNKTLLLAEDNEINFSFLKEALHRTGIKIIHTSNGKETVQAALENNVDLVLMDIKMPVLDGYEATKLIKAKKKTLPVIAQTAYAMANEREESIMSGCDDYLAKPIRISELLAKMAQFLTTSTSYSNTEEQKTKGNKVNERSN